MKSVENNRPDQQGPAAAAYPTGLRLSRSRSALLEALRAQSEPASLAHLATWTGLHANTLREHLDGLRRAGLAERTAAPAVGRGRPEWLYAATLAAEDDPRPEYAGLAIALASVISRTSTQPAEDARRAGVDWGRRLVRDRRPESAASPREAVVEIFDQMGFAPEPDDQDRVVLLTRCPLLAAAHENPEIVCSVHLGVAEGSIAAFGEPEAKVELLPFAERGACLLHLLEGK